MGIVVVVVTPTSKHALTQVECFDPLIWPENLGSCQEGMQIVGGGSHRRRRCCCCCCFVSASSAREQHFCIGFYAAAAARYVVELVLVLGDFVTCIFCFLACKDFPWSRLECRLPQWVRVLQSVGNCEFSLVNCFFDWMSRDSNDSVVSSD